MTRRPTGLLFLCLLSCTVAGRADAALRPAGDLDFALGTQSGSSWAGRLGWELDLVFARLTPEMGVGRVELGPVPDKEGFEIWRGFAGGRLAFGKGIAPSVFAHGGYGRLSTVKALPSEVATYGVTLDGGAAIELTMLPLIDFGLHAGVGTLLPGSAADARHKTTVYAFAGVQMTLRVPAF